jgi:hypothetical protein
MIDHGTKACQFNLRLIDNFMLAARGASSCTNWQIPLHGLAGGENSSVLEGRSEHSAQTIAKSDWLAGVDDPRLQRATQTLANSWLPGIFK